MSTAGTNDGRPDDLIDFSQEDGSNLERVLAQLDVPQDESEFEPLRIECELGEQGFWYTENNTLF